MSGHLLPETMNSLMAEAADRLNEVRRQRDDLKAANDGWKRAFCAVHDALEGLVAAIDFEGSDGRIAFNPNTAFEHDALSAARAAIHVTES